MATRTRRQSVKFIGVVPEEVDHVAKRRCTSNKHVQNTTTMMTTTTMTTTQPVLQEQTLHLKPTFEQRQLLSTYPRNIRLATFIHDREKQLVTAKLHHLLQTTLPLQPIFVLDVRADKRQIEGIHLVFESSLQDAFYLSRKDFLALPNVSAILLALEKIISFNSSAFIKPFYTTKHIENFLQQFLPTLFY